MTGIIGPLIGAGASIGAGIYGSKQADKAKKSAKKAAKYAIKKGGQFISGAPATGKPGTPGYVPAIAGSEAQYGTDIGTQKGVLDASITAAQRAESAQNRLLAANNATTGEAFQPYMDLGTQSLAARQGLYGTDQASADRMIEDFKRSPEYALNYEAALGRGEDALTALGSARGGLNSGNTLKGIVKNAVDVTDPFFRNYVGDINYGIDTGARASQGYSDAMGRNLGYGLDVQGALRNAVIGAQSGYGQNTMQLGQNRLNNLGTGYSVQVQGRNNQAAAAAAAAKAKTDAWTNAASGVAGAFGSYAGGNPFGGGGGGTNPYNTASQMAGNYIQPNRLLSSAGSIMGGGV